MLDVRRTAITQFDRGFHHFNVHQVPVPSGIHVSAWENSAIRKAFHAAGLGATGEIDSCGFSQQNLEGFIHDAKGDER